jgi:isocitrate lyase
MLTIARTDSESAKLIASTVDIEDHEYILGTTTKGKALAQVLAEAEARGADGAEVDKLELEWTKNNKMCTFREAVKQHIKSSSKINESEKTAVLEKFIAQTTSKSIDEMRDLAKEVTGENVYWDCDLPRTREGYYHYTGGIEAAIKRTLTFAPYADLVWLETKEPNLEQARMFARKIREQHPGKWFVYNLSPSFNWSAHGFSETDLKDFIWELGKEGFVLQLISLAGLHSNAVVTAELAEKYKTEGMLAYVNLIQRKEKEIGCDVLTHQKWSGANYIDRILASVSSGSSSTSAIGKDSTEHSF